MAAGDFTVFDQFLTDLGNKIHDMDGDTLKFALVTASVTPAADDAGPNWNGTGTTDYSGDEVTPGGNYSTGGATPGSQAWSVTSNILKFDMADVSISQNASNPTNARWAILYNSTDANKRGIGFLDLGAAIDLSAGDFSYTVPTNGVFRIGVGTIS
jgi:hypothetical protein